MQRTIDRERALSLQRAISTRIAASSLHAAGWSLADAVALLATRRAAK